jgi:hypothetical protein
MSSPVLWGPNYSNDLQSGIGFSNGAGPSIQTGTVNPSAVATAGVEGSLYLNSSSGITYQKQDNGSSTNWSPLAITTGTFTQGSVIFAGSGGVLSQDNTNFFWDEANLRLSLGGHLHTAALGISSTGGTQVGIDLTSTSANTALQVSNQGAQFVAQFINSTNSATQGAAFGGAFSRGTTSARTQSLAGDQLMTFTGQGYTGTQFGPGYSGAIAVIATENTTASANGGELVFASTPNGTLVPSPGLILGQNQLIQLPAYTTAGVLVNDTSGNVTATAVLPVSKGGTGDITLTAYAVLTGGITPTGALQQVSGLGTAGQILTSNGAGALPTWQALGGGGPYSPTVQRFTSGSGTYTTPANVQYIKVRMVGGGGGGSGSGSSTPATPPTDGGTTTFGSSLLTANGGSHGASFSAGGSGGNVVVNSPAISIITASGGSGGGYSANATSSASLPGGSGGGSYFSSVGTGGGQDAGNNAPANSGAGGAGAGSGSTSGSDGGAGGGAGGYVEAIISSPSSTYSYSVGSGGSGGSAGTSGYVGGNGGSGVIEVEEYYSPVAAATSGGGAYTPSVQKFLSGSGTYTTPAGVTYIEVEMVGGGGGAGGFGTASPGAGGSGGNTTFGTSLLVTNGGSGGSAAVFSGITPGGAGGTASLGTGPIGIALTGASGQGGNANGASNAAPNGAMGGSSPFGGAGPGASFNVTGVAAVPNTGSGGGSAGPGGVASTSAGGGGGAGGYVKAIITSPSSTYSYAVGAGGTAGTAGTGGNPGGAGGSGVIIVTEHYANGAVGTATNVTGVVAVANGGTGLNAYVNARYYSSTSSISGSFGVVVYATKDFDNGTGSPNYNTSTGVYTIPVSGVYQINAGLIVNGTSISNPTLAIFKNGSEKTEGNSLSPSGTAGAVAVNDIISCSAGDTISIEAECNGSGLSIGSSNVRNWFSIAKIG